MIENRSGPARTDRDEVAMDCLEAGIAAARPDRVLADSVGAEDDVLTVDGDVYDLGDFERVIALGGGKAGGTMARALEAILGDRIDGGVVVAPDIPETTANDVATDIPETAANDVATDIPETTVIDVVEGAHPTPDEAGVDGTRRVLEAARDADADTLVLGLVSGGGSALLTAPAAPVTLEDVRAVTDELLESGATIREINAVRKHLSESKGGRLATAVAPATTVALVVSDVVGNDLGTIASGPLVPDDTTYEDALAVLDSFDCAVPGRVQTRLEDGVRGDVSETPAADDPAFGRVDVHLLADAMTAIEAAAAVAADAGYEPLVLSSRIRGEASEAAITQVAIAEEVRGTGNPISPPAVLLSGGETTVTIRGDGRGGPNQEFALSAAIELDEPGVTVASVDTDGIDGASDGAGALVDADTVDDVGSARDALADNDAAPRLDDRNAIVRTGPTGTNVNDLRVVVIDRDASRADARDATSFDDE